MKLVYSIFAFFIIVSAQSSYAQEQPWVENNALWKFYYQENDFGGTEGLFEVFKSKDTLVQSKLCDQLITRKIQYLDTVAVDTTIIDTNYTYKSISGDTIFYLQNNVFRILYDFSLNIDDTWLIHVSSDIPDFPCFDSSYTQVKDTSTINLGGVDYKERSYGVTFPVTSAGMYQIGGTGGWFNQRFGPTESNFLFPRPNAPCWNTLDNTFYFLCYEDDSLFYDVNCDYFSSIVEGNTTTYKIYPNPAQNDITIEIEGESFNYQVISLSGKIIHPLTPVSISTLVIDISALPNGYYILQINQEGSYSSTPLVISR